MIALKVRGNIMIQTRINNNQSLYINGAMNNKLRISLYGVTITCIFFTAKI